MINDLVCKEVILSHVNLDAHSSVPLRQVSSVFLMFILSIVLSCVSLENLAHAKGLSEKKALLIANYKYKKRGYSLRTPRQDVK